VLRFLVDACLGSVEELLLVQELTSSV